MLSNPKYHVTRLILHANPSNHTFQDLIEYEKFENADAINNPVAKNVLKAS